MDSENAGDAVAVISYKWISLFFREFQDSENQCAKKSEHNESAEKSPLLTDGTENEIGALFRHEIEFCLGAVKVALTEEAARSDSDFWLVEIEIGAEGVGGFA